MRVLVSTLAETGHFHPVVPIARALQAAGHDVRLAAAPSFAAHVAAAGFPFIPAGTDLASLDAEQPEFLAMDPLARRERARHVVFPSLLPSRRLPALLALADAWPPDLLLVDNYEFAGRVVAEHWGVPHAAVEVAHGYRYAERHALVPALDALRAEVGLPLDPDAAMPFRYLYLICAPHQFQSDVEVLPPTAHRLRREVFDRSGAEELPEWAAALPPRPTVFATVGTVVSRLPSGPPVIAAILAALRDEPITLILTTGRELDPASFGPQPSNVHIERYIPQSLLFPRCDLVVSHCGSGTMLAALDHGLPLVNVPITADQPENAARCAELGVGLTVRPETRTPEAIRTAVRAVLADPTYRANAARVRAEMAAQPGPTYAVELLERLAREKRPLLAE